MIPRTVINFRIQYRARELSRYYSGIGHFCFTSFVSLGVIAFVLSRLERVTWWQLLAVPATFLLANYVEYRWHKGPMHHLASPLGLLFERHTVQHHHFFTHDAMAYEGVSDFKMVLFPPVMLLFFLGLHAVPIAVLLYYLVSPNVAYLNVATAVGYFLTYEWLHVGYHLREDSWVGRLPVMQTLREHHTIHHNLALMNRYNFNITFPICDWLFGTSYKSGAHAQAPSLKNDPEADSTEMAR